VTLIQRQDALVAKLQPLYREHFQRGNPGFMQHTIGLRSRAKRLHREELIAAGYTHQEAMESANQCDAVAYRNADHAQFMAQMGAVA
jgi:hypothetical protein